MTKIIKKRIDWVQNFFEEHSNKISLLFFLFGFILDNLTLKRIDSINVILILLFYLIVSFIFIFLNNYGDYIGFKNKILFKIYKFSAYVIQFAFGALFSGYVIFFTRSGSFFDSWPFLLLLYLVFILNEKIGKLYEKFNIQITIFYFIILSFLIVYLPLLFKDINNWIFIAGLFLSVLILHYIIKLFIHFIPNLKKYIFGIWFRVTLIVILMSILYFLRLLPPVPLAAKDLGIYHFVTKNENNEFIVSTEKKDFWSFDYWFDVYHWKKGEKVYAFASIFAPTGFDTEIQFVWYWWDPKKERWIYKSNFKQKLIGGRDNGFRTYSFIKKAVQPGKWKVVLMSKTGQIIDTKKFEIEEVDYDVILVSEKK